MAVLLETVCRKIKRINAKFLCRPYFGSSCIFCLFWRFLAIFPITLFHNPNHLFSIIEQTLIKRDFRFLDILRILSINLTASKRFHDAFRGESYRCVLGDINPIDAIKNVSQLPTIMRTFSIRQTVFRLHNRPFFILKTIHCCKKYEDIRKRIGSTSAFFHIGNRCRSPISAKLM